MGSSTAGSSSNSRLHPGVMISPSGGDMMLGELVVEGPAGGRAQHALVIIRGATARTTPGKSLATCTRDTSVAHRGGVGTVVGGGAAVVAGVRGTEG